MLASLVEGLDVDGGIRRLESWSRLVDRINEAVQRLITSPPPAAR